MSAEVKRVLTLAYKLALDDMTKAEESFRSGLKEFFSKINAADKKLMAMRSRIEEVFYAEPEPEYDDNGREIGKPSAANEVFSDLEDEGTGMPDIGELRNILGELANTIASSKRELAKRYKELMQLAAG